ncbi:MAG: hypothetical protein HC904_04720 [Blastochloris sp.]|nr:hypothetical protein [Blastochloris sp.]
MNLPASSIDPTEAIRNHTPCWWVIHTRPRCEKKMDQWFTDRGWDHYLPTRSKKRSYPGKIVTFQHPLFAGYTFGVFNLLQRNAVYGSGHAAGILEVVDQAQLIRELEILKLALAQGHNAQECPYLKVGQRTRITLGQLRGLEGIVLRHKDQTRMIVSVEILQRSVSWKLTRIGWKQ